MAVQKYISILSFVCFAMLVNGCNPEIEMGYSPPLVPIRISINTSGEIKVGISGAVATPYGTFDCGGDLSIVENLQESEKRLLIIKLDDEATVYELDEGRKFEVKLDEDNQYQNVHISYLENGNIYLELETIEFVAGNPKVVNQSPAQNSSNPTFDADCSESPPLRFQIGERVIVCTKVDRLILRNNPGRSAPELDRLDPGTVLKIINGPVCKDRVRWWQVEPDFGWTAGWVMDGQDNVDPYFICPLP